MKSINRKHFYFYAILTKLILVFQKMVNLNPLVRILTFLAIKNYTFNNLTKTLSNLENPELITPSVY